MIKHASGISPEELSLLDAFVAGQRAGFQGRAKELNDYAEGTPEHNEWERGRRSAEASFLATFARA